MNKYIVIIVSVLISLSSSFGYFTDFASTKVAGMCSAYTAIAFDENAPDTNPAGLAFIDPGLIGHFNFDTTLQTDDSTAKFYKKYNDYLSKNPKPFLDPAFQAKAADTSIFYSAGGKAVYFTRDFAIGGHVIVATNQQFNKNGIVSNQNENDSVKLSHAFKVLPFLSLGTTVQLAQKQKLKIEGSWNNLQDRTDYCGIQNLLTQGTNGVQTVYKIHYAGANVGAMMKLGDFSLGYVLDNAWASTKTWKESHPSYNIPFSETDTGNIYDQLTPVQHVGIGYSNQGQETVWDLDVSNPGIETDQVVHFGYQKRLMAVPFVEWLGESILRVGYSNGKQKNVPVEQLAIGTRLKLWLFTADVSAEAQRIDDQPITNQESVSLQVTW